MRRGRKLTVVWSHRLIAVYLYLDMFQTRSVEPVEHDSGLLVDYFVSGAPLGIERLHLHEGTFDAINQRLEELGEAPATRNDLALLLDPRTDAQR